MRGIILKHVVINYHGGLGIRENGGAWASVVSVRLMSDLIYLALKVGLPKEKERELNDAIQVHFREWLQSTNLLRQIYDLSNLERDESSSGGPPGYGSGQAPAPK
jgi:hypothetical protein